MSKVMPGKGWRWMKFIFDVASVGALVLVAFSFGTKIWSGVRGSNAEPPRVSSAAQVNWSSTGIWEGPRAATVRIVNFTDYTCHFCARQDSILRALRLRYPDHVAVITKHVPNPQSEVASRLSLIGRCADITGNFRNVNPMLYRLADPNSSAQETMQAVRQLVGTDAHKSIEQCMSTDSAVGRVRADLADGKLLNLQVTPVLIVNGLIRPGVAELEVLDALVLSEMRRVERDFLQKSQRSPVQP